MRRAAIALSALACLLTFAAPAVAGTGGDYDPSGWPHQPGPPAVGENGMVVTAHPVATSAGLEVLREGGNAVDAAVAATFALAVVEPWSSGIGGGGFMLFHRAIDDETAVLDFREQAPLAAHRDMYLRGGEYVRELSQRGWLAAGTPGAVAGLLQAIETWGTLPRERLLQPAIEAAENGFAVTERYHQAVGRTLEHLRNDPEAASIFLVPGEGPDDPPVQPPLGHIVRQPDLARTLRRIAEEGRDGFYKGPVAEAIARGAAEGGGLITREDLEAYAPIEREPVVIRYRDLVLHAMPPPSSGGVVLAQLLGITERFDLSREGFDDPRRLHLLAEAMRRSYADRNVHLGDPAFVKNPVAELTDPEYLAGLRRTIDPLRATPSDEIRPYAPGDLADAGDQTSHLSVVDAAGNAVALTNTVNFSFGACVVAPGTGVLMNNEMDDFAAAPGRPNMFGLVQHEANAIAPRKIPLSSMSPTIVLREDESGSQRLYMVLGSPGGPTIITQVFQFLVNVHLFGMNIAEAVAAPRIHHQWLPDRILMEGGFSDETVAALEALGHEIVQRRDWGNAHAIVVDPKTGRLEGAPDPRGEGVAAGF
jgi:gamma-glutamyltranspeptidase / glutathione hydrolase